MVRGRHRAWRPSGHPHRPSSLGHMERMGSPNRVSPLAAILPSPAPTMSLLTPRSSQWAKTYPILVIPLLGNFTQFRSYRFWVKWFLVGGAVFATRHQYHPEDLDGTDRID